MGKKIALGCLGVALVVLIGGGYLTYTFVYKPVMGSMESLQQVHQQNEQIENQSTYSEPADGELTETQVERFVAVQKQIQSGVENRLTEFQQKYEQLDSELQNREPTIREIMNAWGDIMGLYSDAKQIQVEALNDHDFSLEEYRFVQQRFYQALGVELFAYNIDEIAAAASQGDFQNMNPEEFRKVQQEMEQVPEINRELASQYADSADAWLVFSWWGL
jgi:flagellar basal body-associated protein FliL